MFKIEAYTFFTVLTVDLLATSGDIAATWTSPILPKLYSNDSSVNPFSKPITSEEDSWIVSLLNLGAIIGPFLYGFISEKLGRKVALLSVGIPHIISYLTFAFGNNFYLYYFGRFLQGIAMGGGYTLLPTYLAEISKDENRGMISSTLNPFWTFGNLLPYVIGPFISVMWFNIILACVPTLFFCSFFFTGPESPYYLMIKNKRSKAEESLMKLRSGNKKQVEAEILEIQTEIQENKDDTTLLQFLSTKVFMKGLLISFVLLIAQQLSGITAILMNTEKIFEEAGANGLAPEISSIIIGLMIFVSSFQTIFVVDRWGRKTLMIISLLGITLSHAALGLYFYLKSVDQDVSSISWLPLLSLVSYILTFNLGLGPLPWTIASELFPTNVKSYSASLVTSICWVSAFFVTKFFNQLSDAIGIGETFWLFGASAFVAFLFTVFFVPETKGKSFQEIQEMLGG